MTRSVPVAPNLFTWPSDEPRLIGCRCGACGTTVFPRQDGCPRCTAVGMHDVLLPRVGTLWSFTVQGFRPKPPYTGPTDFEPYGVGYVQLEDAVIVEARLTTHDPAELAIDMPMELVIVPFRTEADGTEVTTFAFRPALAAGGELVPGVAGEGR
jgi:uncharacterized protein